MKFNPPPSTIGREFTESRIHLRSVERESKVYKKKVDIKSGLDLSTVMVLRKWREASHRKTEYPIQKDSTHARRFEIQRVSKPPEQLDS
jgi:hypothetical protein